VRRRRRPSGLVDEAGFVDANGDEVCGAGEFDPARLLVDQHGNVIANQYDAINNVSDRDQHNYGATLQATFRAEVFARENQLIVGASYDRGRVEYRSQVEVAVLQADRSTNRSGLLAVDQASAIDSNARTWSAYFTDTLSITPRLALTLSGRFNDSAIELRNAGTFGDAERLSRLQRGCAHADTSRARMRESDRAVHAAEYVRRRPAPRAGRGQNIRNRASRSPAG
jgi:hypothetical protein